jgi:predicted AlkP superfamily pyrophosphatase or phosphodiesterase
MSTTVSYPPERLHGQGLCADQWASGDRAILALLTDDIARDEVDLVLTWRDGAYEVWARRGMLRFVREIDDEGRIVFRDVEVIGENPIADDDHFALARLEDERAAAARHGFAQDDHARRFIPASAQSYPFGRERIAQLFDSPNAPDIAISTVDWCTGSQPGTHGALHVRQARAPLWFRGPGVVPGRHRIAARAVDIAPTCLAALGFPHIDGADATGRTSSERGVQPDVFLARQDGRVLTEILDATTVKAERLYVFLLDGLHQTELEDRLARASDDLPNLRRLRRGAGVLDGGSIVNFPSITWPSHTTILTGSWCGHHDVVNPTYHLRERDETVSPQGQQMHTERFASSAVESLYEAFHRVLPDGLTAAIHAPFGRSARHAVLEGRNLCDRSKVKARTADLVGEIDPRWEREHPAVALEALLDARGTAQVLDLLDRDDIPVFVYHELAMTDGAGHDYGPHGEGIAAALDETDRRIGHVLDALEALGMIDSTLFVVTADHGMAPQDTERRANPVWRLAEHGIEAVLAEPMVWLRDMAVETWRASDGRSAHVDVAVIEVDESGERSTITGADVLVELHRPGRTPVSVARGSTDADGRFAFATPNNADSRAITLSIRSSGRNPRHLRLDGSDLGPDLRGLLYAHLTQPM